MPAPQLKQQDPKTVTTRKPTAQDLHQKTKARPEPAVNPTNTADTSPDTPLNHGTGYSTPDAPSEGDATTNNLKADGGDKEVPNPVEDTPLKMDGDYPTQDNPKM